MPQDFAKKKKAPTSPRAKAERNKHNVRKKNSKKRKAPLWLWLLACTLVIAFAWFLTQLPSNQPSPTVDKPRQGSNTEEGQGVRFDFYDILTEHEVKVDEKLHTHAPKTEKVIYFLQAGSFKTLADADALRARLLLLGLPASTEKTRNQQQQIWYRTLAGPFDSRSALAKARSILASHEINNFVIKRRP